MLRVLIISTFIILVGCQAYNTSSSDEIKYSGDGTPFSNAQIVFATKCTPCHSFHVTSEKDMIFNGLVVKGDIYSSPIYLRLKGAQAGGQEDMPINGQLTAEEIETIENWIDE